MVDLDTFINGLEDQIKRDEAFIRLITEIRRLRESNRGLMTALEWYSLQCRYEWNSEAGFIGTSLIQDGGTKAREALAKYSETKE